MEIDKDKLQELNDLAKVLDDEATKLVIQHSRVANAVSNVQSIEKIDKALTSEKYSDLLVTLYVKSGDGKIYLYNVPTHKDTFNKIFGLLKEELVKQIDNLTTNENKRDDTRI